MYCVTHHRRDTSITESFTIDRKIIFNLTLILGSLDFVLQLSVQRKHVEVKLRERMTFYSFLSH